MDYILRCPTCGSVAIHPVIGGCLGQVYRCQDCGYRGSFVLEQDVRPQDEDEEMLE